MKLFFTLLSFLLSSCSSATEVVTDEGTFMSYKLRLTSNDGACILYVNETSKYPLVPKPPCYFTRRNNTRPQHYSYSDVNVDAVLIVVGTPINNEKRKMLSPGLPDNLVCGEAIQGILIKKDVVRPSRNVQGGGVICKDKGLDEKDFWYFAHDTQSKK